MKEKIFVLFFDAKMETVVQRKEYQSFLKEIKKIGYIILQKSVYIKHVCDDQRLKEETKKINNITPKTIEVRLLSLTRTMFEKISNINCEKVKLLENNSIICF